MNTPTSTSTLRLVRPDAPESADAPQVLPLERRQETRYVISQRVTAVRRQQDGPDVHNSICSLQLLNISDAGLGALSQEPIDPNVAITVFFPPHGNERGFDLQGRVVRCQQRNAMYEIGIRCAKKAAA